MAGKRKRKIADQDEVLAMFTAIMRGEVDDYVVRKSSGGEEVVPVPPKLSDRTHAAQLLAKRFGLSTPAEEAPLGDAVQAIEEAIRSMGGSA